MAEWFNQARFDLNSNSTRDLIAWAKARVDTALDYARMDFPPRTPSDTAREAQSAIEQIFMDKPVALVMNAAGQSRDALVQALERGKFEVVLSGLDSALHYGKERELPAAAALAALSIEAQARYNSAQEQVAASINADQLRQLSAGQLPAVRERLVSAAEDARAALQTGSPRDKVMGAVDRAIDASRSYWQVAAESGRKITSAAKAADSEKQRAAQGRGQARAR